MHPDIQGEETKPPGTGGSGGMRAWCRQLLADLGKEPSGPGFRLVGGVIVPLGLGVLLTIWVRWSDFDYAAQDLIYRAGGDSWAVGQLGFWKFLYHWGTLPAAIVAILAALGYLLSWYREALRRWRLVFCFLFLTLLIGPGLIVNAALKDHWGRPRPRDVVGLGGIYPFEPVFHVDPASPGKSFPSGHATMGFYFAGGFFLLRRHRRRLAIALLCGGIVFGAVIGFGRMAQGGHFFSDVIWAGLVCHFTAMGIYYGLGLHRGLLLKNTVERKRMPPRLKLAASVLLAAVLAGVLVATPHERKWESPASAEVWSAGDESFDLRLSLRLGEVRVVPRNTLGIAAESHGHGFPRSRIGRKYLEEKEDGIRKILYKEWVEGWFSELNSKLEVGIPWDGIRKLSLETGDAIVRIDLAAVEGIPTIEVLGGAGRIHIQTGGQPFHLVVKGDAGRIEGLDSLPVQESGSGVYELHIAEPFSGLIRFEGPVPR